MTQNMLHERPSKIATIRTVPAGSGQRSAVADPGASHLSQGFPSIAVAYADLPTNGGTIFLEAGTHYMPAQLTVAKKVRFIGAGMGVTIIKASATITSMFYIYNGGNECQADFDGITFDADDKADACIKAGAYGRVYERDCEFKNCVTYGSLLQTAMESSIFDCKYRAGATKAISIVDEANSCRVDNTLLEVASGDTGIFVGRLSGNYCQNPVITRCRVYGTGTKVGTGIHIQYAYGAAIRDSRVFNLNHGVELGDASYGCEMATLDNIYCFLNDTGIQLTQSARTEIRGGDTDGDTTWLNIDGGGLNSYTTVWNLHGHTMVDNGVQTRTFIQGVDALGLATASTGLSVGTLTGDKGYFTHDGGSAYFRGTYHGNVDNTKHFNMASLNFTGGVLYPVDATGNGLACRVKSTTGAPTDAEYGSAVGTLVWNSADSEFYIKATATTDDWHKVALA